MDKQCDGLDWDRTNKVKTNKVVAITQHSYYININEAGTSDPTERWELLLY